MPRPPRRIPPPHTLVVDTSILWHRDKANVVSPEFETFWQDMADVIAVKLVVPGVVRGEILFQQTTSALKALDKANQHISEVSAITDRRYSHRVTEERVRSQVEERIDRWLNSKAAVIALAPVELIDWNSVIHSAVWRHPPFTYDPKNPEHEKGFRDCLILETVSHYVQNHQDETIAFICNDRLLREAAESRLADNVKCSFYDSLSDFASYVRLLQQQLTDRFVKSIVSRARRKFFTRRDMSSLYYKANLYKRITSDFAAELQVDEDFQSRLMSALTKQAMHGQWQWSGPEQIRIANPQFQRLDEPNTFHWSSVITIIRPFHREVDPTSLAAVFGSVEEKALTASFVIRWYARVAKDGSFRTCDIEGVELKEKTFDALTTEQRERFGLTRSGE
jgi:hypothetical protein